MDGWMNGWQEGWMDEGMGGWMGNKWRRGVRGAGGRGQVVIVRWEEGVGWGYLREGEGV